MSGALVDKQSKLGEPSYAAAAKDPLHCSWRSKWWSWSGRATSRRSRRAGQFCRRRPLWCDLPARRQVLEKRHRRDPATCWVLIAARAARSCQHGVHVPGAGASHVAAVPVRRCPACSSACAEVLDHACAEITLCCRLLCHRPRITTAPPRSRPRPGQQHAVRWPSNSPSSPLHCPRQCPRPTLAQRCATERVPVPGARPAALRVRVRARASPVVRSIRILSSRVGRPLVAAPTASRHVCSPRVSWVDGRCDERSQRASGTKRVGVGSPGLLLWCKSRCILCHARYHRDSAACLSASCSTADLLFYSASASLACHHELLPGAQLSSGPCCLRPLTLLREGSQSCPCRGRVVFCRR